MRLHVLTVLVTERSPVKHESLITYDKITYSTICITVRYPLHIESLFIFSVIYNIHCLCISHTYGLQTRVFIYLLYC
jgi:hypothetical protein